MYLIISKLFVFKINLWAKLSKQNLRFEIVYTVNL